MNDDVEREIIKILSSWCYEIEINNNNSYYDINKKSENVVRDLLNCLEYGNFRNCNEEEKNFKGIDLIDDEKRIGIQVTTDQSLTKIKETLRKSDDTVEKVHMFYLTTKLKKHQSNLICNNPKFDINHDILYFNDILNLSKKNNKESEILEILIKYFKTYKLNIEDIKLNNYQREYSFVELNTSENENNVVYSDNYGSSKTIYKQFDEVDGYLYDRVFKEKKKTSKDFINNTILKVIDWIVGDSLFPIKDLEKMYRCYDNNSLNVDNKILKSRRNALLSFYSGDIKKTKNIYDKLFNKINNIKVKWFKDDILIDGRNIIYRFESIDNTRCNNKFDEQIRNLDYNIQYPSIDRIEKDLLNKSIDRSFEYKYKNRHTSIYGIGLEDVFSNIQKIIYSALLYGSITQLNIVRQTIARVLIIYANGTEIEDMYNLALKYYILCGDYKEFKNIVNKMTFKNEKIESTEYLEEILKLRKSKIIYDIDYFDIFIFDFYGRLLNDKDFNIYQNRIFKILNNNHIPKNNSAINTLPSNIVRFKDVKRLLLVLKKLVSRGYSRQIQRVLNYFEYEELNDENKKILKEIISIIISNKEYIVIDSLLFDIKKIDGVNDYDNILFKYEDNKLLYQLMESNSNSVSNLKKIVNEINIRTENALKTGVISGYMTEYTITSDFFKKDSKALRKVINDNIFPLVDKSLSSKKLTYKDKLKLLRVLIYIYYFDNSYSDNIEKILKSVCREGSDSMFEDYLDNNYFTLYDYFFYYIFKKISLNQLLKKYILLSNNMYMFEEIRIILEQVFINEKVDDECFDILSILVSNMLVNNYEENRINAIRLSKILYYYGLFNDVFDKLSDISKNGKYREMRAIVVLLRDLPKNDDQVNILINNILNNDNFNIRYMGKKYLIEK